MEKHTNEVEDNQMRALSWKTRVSYGLGDTACNVVLRNDRKPVNDLLY